MLKMNALQRSATESAEMRNHALGSWDDLDDHRVAAVCVYCHREVVCNVRPQVNEIPVGGEAIAVNCDGIPAIAR